MVNEHRFMTGLNNVSWGQINADGSISAEAIKRNKGSLNELFLSKTKKDKKAQPKKHKKWKKKMGWKTSLPKNDWGTVTLNEDGAIHAKASFDPDTSKCVANEYDAKLNRLKDELNTKLAETSHNVEVIKKYQSYEFIRLNGAIRKMRAQIYEIKRTRKTNR